MMHRGKDVQLMLVLFEKPGPSNIQQEVNAIKDYLCKTEGLNFPEDVLVDPSRDALGHPEIHAWRVPRFQVTDVKLIHFIFGHLAGERRIDLTQLDVEFRQIDTDNPNFPNISVTWAAKT